MKSLAGDLGLDRAELFSQHLLRAALGRHSPAICCSQWNAGECRDGDEGLRETHPERTQAECARRLIPKTREIPAGRAQC